MHIFDKFLEDESLKVSKAIEFSKSTETSQQNKFMVPLLEEIEYKSERDGFKRGTEIMDKILLDLNKFDQGVTIGTTKYIRLKYHREIHHAILGGLVPVIFGDEIAKLYQPEIRERYGFEYYDTNNKHKRFLIAVMLSRRMGKTVGVVIITAVLMCHVPGITISCIANTYKASVMFIEQVYPIILHLTGRNKLDVNSKLRLEIHKDHEDIRVVKAESGVKPDNIRGFGPKFLILEEAAYINERTFTHVVVPVLKMKKVCMVAISTLHESENNYFNEIVRQNIMRTIKYELICTDCYKKGIRDICPHRERPPWHSEENDDVLRRLIGNDDAYERENLGMDSAGLNNQFFPDTCLDNFFYSTRPFISVASRYVFVSVDLASGTAAPNRVTTDFVCVSITYPELYLVGMEANAIRHYGDAIPTIKDHIKAVNHMRGCEGATFILDIVAQNNITTNNILENVASLKEIRMTTAAAAGRHKMGTRRAGPEEYAPIALRTMESGRIKIAQNFISLTHPNGPNGMLHDLHKQLKAFKRKVEIYAHYSRVTFSGRGDRNSEPDDLAVGFQRAIRLVEGFKSLGVMMK